MILLTVIICYLMILKWQVRHVHWVYGQLEYGDRILHLGRPATVVQRLSDSMVIRRDLSSLFGWGHAK